MTVAEGWEYADADTSQHVHGLHPWPARMIPQVANRIIREWSNEQDTVLDPFCGSGSVLVEALLNSRNAVGVDINPLAYLISKVKTTQLTPELLLRETGPLMEEIGYRIEALRKGEASVKTFVFRNIFHWFKKDVVDELTVIKETISNAEKSNKDIYDFLKVCFSMTLRKASNIAFDDNPYFIRVKKGEPLKKHSPDVRSIFEKQLSGSITRMGEFISLHPDGLQCSVHNADARVLPIEDGSIDLIVTSPPYGEESHTMAYTRFAKLTLQWLGFTPSDVRRIEGQSLGGKAVYQRPLTENIDEMLKTVEVLDKRRSKEVFSFIWDYHKCLKEMYRVLAPNKCVGIVIGDRTAKGVKVSNEVITKELGKQVGFEEVTTYEREIPKKVLPRRDYKVELINREYIIIMKKP